MSHRLPVLCVLLVPILAAPGFADETAATCGARKLSLAGGYARCLSATEAKALRTGGTAATAGCDARLAAKFAAVERKLGESCPGQGDVDVVQAAARRFIAGLAATAQGRL